MNFKLCINGERRLYIHAYVQMIHMHIVTLTDILTPATADDGVIAKAPAIKFRSPITSCGYSHLRASVNFGHALAVSVGARQHEDLRNLITGDLCSVHFAVSACACRCNCDVRYTARDCARRLVWNRTIVTVSMVCSCSQVLCLAVQLDHADSQVAGWTEYVQHLIAQ